MQAPALESARILIVDDQEANVRLLERILRHAGYHRIRSTTEPRRVASLFTVERPDILLLDLHMPEVDGFVLLEELRPLFAEEVFFPVLMLTADASAEVKHRALSIGAKDFLIKPFDATEALLRIHNLLEMRFLHLELSQENRVLEDRVRERTQELEESQREILERLAQAAEFHDDDTGLHTRRVGELAALLAFALGLPSGTVEVIRHTAPLHDVGKIGIPETVLQKPGELDVEERAVMQHHTTIGARILSGGRSEAMRMAEEIAWCHHERWDGGGYPRGLQGEEIPLAARIVAVADVFDALAHDRPYRSAWPLERVLAEIRAGRGTHFDPRVVAAFAEVRDAGRLPR